MVRLVRWMFGRDDREGDTETRRERMVEKLRERGRIERETTAAALESVPRHEFLPESRRDSAYADRPLPIGAGQTISAPHMVAVMTDLLELKPGDRVLEVGTGCGYHAAVTAEIVGPENVYSVEYVEELATDARDRFEELGYDIKVRVGDGWEGWPERAPFDAAYLTCAAPEIPPPVVDQLEIGGRLVSPIGNGRQVLIRAFKTDDGLEREQHGGVRFVPLQRDE
ncbi:MAG: protein-L-isoaspartate(D-aspartate) O-methyltransferase [Natronomonas sp.]